MTVYPNKTDCENKCEQGFKCNQVGNTIQYTCDEILPDEPGPNLLAVYIIVPLIVVSIVVLLSIFLCLRKQKRQNSVQAYVTQPKQQILQDVHLQQQQIQ
ncbi:Hypothetical_protein [Hexamita inflata]|uniref:Hypothetical_protein n=1 Tax=Hexamita inflata TaxID=28002 RepID=A0AA86P9Z6_9EUKA|nr:Hypothetical protein HINF_LOCUS1922 [Hexamita inflata]CAI9934695.1 Hypothetical protein HINF_LOCUS22340 [Hexamita inflata]